MTEQDWTVKNAPPRPADPTKHLATVDGLSVEITVEGREVSWTVRGFLDEYPVTSAVYWRRMSLDEAKAQAIDAAHRLYEAGVRGKEEQP